MLKPPCAYGSCIGLALGSILDGEGVLEALHSQTIITGPILNLTQGSHTLKLVFDIGLIDLNWREFSQSSTPTPITPVSCHQYTPGSTIPTGFSVPWDTQSGMNELLIKATCQNTTAATLDFGRGVSTQYIYQTGYHYHAGMADWTPMTMTSTESLISEAR